MYKIPLQKQAILASNDVEQLFPSLEELIHFHSDFCSQLKERVALAGDTVKSIADLLLHRVSHTRTYTHTHTHISFSRAVKFGVM